MIDASPKPRWSAERLGSGEGLFRGWGRRGITLSYARPGRGGGRRNLLVAEVEAKMGVGANSEEVK